MTYELHPLCTLFPRVEGAEFDALVSDIRANGLRQPIVLHGGMILDGGNRYRACQKAGVEPEFINFDGDNIVSFVLSANLHRRHLSAGQQAAIVASAQDWAKAQTHGGLRASVHVNTCLQTTEQRAAQSGASVMTQRRADKVAKADPELAKKVAHGEVSLPKAVQQVEQMAGKAEPKKPDDMVSRLRARIGELESELAELREVHDEAMSNMAVMADELSAYKRAADPEHALKFLQQEQYRTTLESQRDDLMNQCAALKREVKALRRRMEAA